MYSTVSCLAAASRRPANNFQIVVCSLSICTYYYDLYVVQLASCSQGIMIVFVVLRIMCAIVSYRYVCCRNDVFVLLQLEFNIILLLIVAMYVVLYIYYNNKYY